MSETLLIDRILAVQRFTEMLDSSNKKRILRIIGAENMGKSRLMREFRKLSHEKWKGNCALIDLRSKFQSYSDIVFQITQQIPSIEYDNFLETQQQILSSSKVEIKGANLLLSTISVSMPEQKRNSDDEYIRQKITSSFCRDLYSAKLDCPTVLLFDTFDGAGSNVQNWLNEQFILAILQIPNIYLVLAGRYLPDLSNTWLDVCETYTLLPVTLADHISYCDRLGVDASIEVIEAFHKAFDGVPGLFAIYAPKLLEK